MDQLLNGWATASESAAYDIKVVVSAANSTLSAAPVAIAADNNDASTITFTARDSQNNSVLGLTETEIGFSSSGSYTLTDFNEIGSGVYTIKLKGSTIGYRHITVSLAPSLSVDVSVGYYSVAKAGTCAYNNMPNGTVFNLTPIRNAQNTFDYDHYNITPSNLTPSALAQIKSGRLVGGSAPSNLHGCMIIR